MKSVYDLVYTVLACRTSVRDVVRSIPLPDSVEFIVSAYKLLVCL